MNAVPAGTADAASPTTRLVTVRLPLSAGTVPHGIDPANR